MDKLIHACIAILELKRPVDVRFVSRIKNKNWHAYYVAVMKDDKVIKNIIRVSLAATLDSDREVNTIIAHEFVHAWQAENGKSFDKPHGKVFQAKATELRYLLISDGFDIDEKIYDPDVDQ